MGKQRTELLDERAFDGLLKNALDETPPEDVVQDVTPWRKAMNRILWGLALTSIIINFRMLNYILPAGGFLLMLLGFRILRRENNWFRACWGIVLVRAIYFFGTLILNTMPVHSTVCTSPAGDILLLMNLILTFIQLFCLWRGLCTTQKKAGQPVHAGSAVALMIWYGVIACLGLAGFQGSIIGGIIFLIVYILIICSLYRLSKVLEEAGYAIKTAQAHVSDRGLVITILAAVSIGMTCGYLFDGSYTMDWEPVKAKTMTQTAEMEKQLLSLGFPKEVLRDLTAEDLKACEGALRVVAVVNDRPVDERKELRITGVAVELPGEREQWKIFHHFLWTGNPGFYGTESIQFWPAYHHGEGWGQAGEFTGRLLYDKDGEVYTAPYHFLGQKTYTEKSIFWGEQVSTDVFAAFSLPKDGENQRGYVTYNIKEMTDGWIVDSWINYTHQRSWMQYPARTAMDQRIRNGWNEAGAFYTVQDALQFYPTEDDIEIIN